MTPDEIAAQRLAEDVRSEPKACSPDLVALVEQYDRLIATLAERDAEIARMESVYQVGQHAAEKAGLALAERNEEIARLKLEQQNERRLAREDYNVVRDAAEAAEAALAKAREALRPFAKVADDIDRCVPPLATDEETAARDIFKKVTRLHSSALVQMDTKYFEAARAQLKE